MHETLSPGRTRLLLAAILLLALALRLVGFDSGLPGPTHAYTDNPDEFTPLQVLKRMEPRTLDFNPHYFDDPTFQYYLYGLTIGAGHAVGWLDATGNEKFYFDHPENVARMILLGRLWSLVLGTATVWLVYLLARRLGFGRGTALLASLLLALYPSHIIHSRFMTVNVPVAFWTILSFLALERWMRRPGFAGTMGVALTAGLALSSKYSAGLMLGVIVVAAFFRARGGGGPVRWKRFLGDSAGVLGLTLAVFLAGSPYIVLAFPEFMEMLNGFLLPVFTGTGGPGFAFSARRALEAYFYASTPFLLLAALAGAILVVRRGRAAGHLVVLWLAAFFLICLKAGALASDGRFQPAFPPIALLGGVALGSLLARRRRLGMLVLTLVLLPITIWDHALLRRFTGPQQQHVASDWAREHLRGPVKVAIAGESFFYLPDLVLREFLQEENVGNYGRQTEWILVRGEGYAEIRPQEPDIVFQSVYLSHASLDRSWLEDPEYEIIERFEGSTRLFGRRIHPRLDLYDADTWVLKRKGADLAPGS